MSEETDNIDNILADAIRRGAINALEAVKFSLDELDEVKVLTIDQIRGMMDKMIKGLKDA